MIASGICAAGFGSSNSSDISRSSLSCSSSAIPLQWTSQVGRPKKLHSLVGGCSVPQGRQPPYLSLSRLKPAYLESISVNRPLGTTH